MQKDIYEPIAPTSEEVIAAIRHKTALSLPDDPAAASMKAATIKRRFWEAICGGDASLLSELRRIVGEVNAAIDAVIEGYNAAEGEREKVTRRAEAAADRVAEGLHGDRVYVRYSAYPDGRGYVSEWARGLNYIGIAVGLEEPTDASGYEWQLMSPGVYVGSGEMPGYADIQIDPEGAFGADLGVDTVLMTEAGHVSGYGSIVAPCSTNDTIHPNSSGIVTDRISMVQEAGEDGGVVFRFYSASLFEAPRGVLIVWRYWPESEGRYQYAHIVANAPSEDAVCSDGAGNDIYLLGEYAAPVTHTGVDEQYSQCYFAGILTEDKITAAQAHGIGCIAAEMGAFAAGYLARAIGRQALAIGFDVEASAPSAVAIGYALIARSIQQTVLGRYNVPDADERYAFLFGNGKDEEHRSNAMWMDWSGNVGFQGAVHSDALLPRDEHDLVTRYYLERALAANGEVCILRNDELDPYVQLGNAETDWSTPTEYTADIVAPFAGFGGAYVTDGADFSSRWILQVKLPSGIDVSGSHLIGIWLAVEPTGTGTLSATIQIELTSTGTADKQEKRFDLSISDGTLAAGAWRFYVLDLANPKGASPFIGYSGITAGEPDETAINYMRVLGVPVTNGRVMVGKCVAIPRHMSVLTGVRGVFADGITVGDVTLTGAQLAKLKALI